MATGDGRRYVGASETTKGRKRSVFGWLVGRQVVAGRRCGIERAGAWRKTNDLAILRRLRLWEAQLLEREVVQVSLCADIP
jgi:hypothetical protein